MFRVCSSFSTSTTSVSSGGSDMYGSGHNLKTDKEEVSVNRYDPSPNPKEAKEEIDPVLTLHTCGNENVLLQKEDENYHEIPHVRPIHACGNVIYEIYDDTAIKFDRPEEEQNVSGASSSSITLDRDVETVFGPKQYSYAYPMKDRVAASATRFQKPPPSYENNRVTPLRPGNSPAAIKVERDYKNKPPYPLPIKITPEPRRLHLSDSPEEITESVICNRPGKHSQKEEDYYDSVLPPTESPRNEQETDVGRDYKFKPPYPLPIKTTPVPRRLTLSDAPEEITDGEIRPKTRTDSANRHKDSGHSDVFQYLETGPIDIKRIHALSFEEIERCVQNVQNETAVQKKKTELIQQLKEALEGLSSGKDTMIHSVTESANVDKRLKTQQSDLESIAADQEDIQNQDVYPSKGIYSAKQLEIQNKNKNGNVATAVSEASAVGFDSVLTEKIDTIQEKPRKLSSKDSAIYSSSQSQMYPIMEAHEQE